ncbi:hypothetical protein [Promicromonospora sp. NPDC057488]|uniref:hypothetical protein n=1 Tax=Promicromonospora sp. NPDC057488 TaxID=3346147 RepID=UPI00366E0326
MTARNDMLRIGAAVLGAGVIAAGGLFVPAALADAAPTEAAAAVAADELPPFAVEDFDYPGADRILEERGFLLKRGDGHIVLAGCSDANVIRVSARGLANEDVCFRVTGNSGHLTLELNGTYLVQTNNYGNTHLELTAASGDEQVYDVGPNDLQSVGESDPGSEGQRFALLEIRVSR